MRSRSITGPVILVVIGFLFLVNNVWRNVPFWSLMWDYWPVLLIVVGVIGLVEALYFASRGVVILRVRWQAWEWSGSPC